MENNNIDIKKEDKVNLNDFLKNARIKEKYIVLPYSKLEIKIKKINQKEWVLKYNDLFMIPQGKEIKIERPFENQKETNEKIEKFNFNLLEEGCIYPKITCEDTLKDNELFIEYLSLQDKSFLTNEILYFSGIIPEIPSITK